MKNEKNEREKEKKREEIPIKYAGNGRHAKFSAATATRARKVENNCGIAVADATEQSENEGGRIRRKKQREK